MILIALSVGCGQSSDRILTAVAERKTFILSLTVEGTVDAQRSYALLTPMVRPHQPEIAYLAEEGAQVKKGEIVVAFSPDKYEADLRDALRELTLARADMERTKAEHQDQISQLEAQIKNAEASAEAARLQYARLEFVAPREREIQKLEIERSLTEAEKNKKKLEFLKNIQKEEITRMLITIKQAEAKANSAKSMIDRLRLPAPADGIVMYERNRMTGEPVKEGDMLYPNFPVAKIPALSVLQVNLEISETEAQKLNEGQTVHITMPSLDGLTFPGHVDQVGRTARPLRRGSRVKVVECAVLVDSTAEGLVPGLTAICTIETQTFPDTVVVPLDCLFEKDSAQVVYKKEGEDFTIQKVAVGLRGFDFAIISAGLNGGEELALREPE